MKIMKHNFIHFILVFYLFSSYLSTTHLHHDPFVSHTDCKICMINSNLLEGDIPVSQSAIVIPKKYFENFSLRSVFIAHTTEKGFHSHAPPYSS